MTILPATDYYVRVKAIGLSGESEYSDTVKVTTLPNDNVTNLNTPVIPNVLSVVVRSNQVIIYLEHTDNRNTYIYTVSTNSDYSNPLYNNVSVLSHNLVKHLYNNTACDLLSITGLEANTTYYLKLKCSNYLGSSNFREITFKTKTELPAPVILGITNLTNTSATLNWNPIIEASGYRLDLSSSSTFTSYVIENLDVGNVLNYTFSPLLEATNYYVRLRAYTPSQTSDNSEIYAFKTLTGSDSELGLSNQLQSVIITSIYNVNINSYSLEWHVNKNYNLPETLVSTVYTALDNNFTDIVDTTTTVNNFAVITNLDSNTTYYIKITVTNGFSTISSTYLTVKTLETSSTLNAPTIYTVTNIGSTKATVNFSIVNNASRYYLELSNLSNFSNVLEKIYLNSNYNSYTFINLTSNTQYYVRIAALNDLYSSSFSVIANFTTNASLPVIELNLPEVVSESEVKLSWSIDPVYIKYTLTIFNEYGYVGNNFYRNFNLGYVGTYTVKLFLQPGTSYNYLITGITNLDEHKESSLGYFTTKHLPPSIYVNSNSSGITVEGIANRLYVSLDNLFTTCIKGFNPYQVNDITNGTIRLSTLLRDENNYFIKATYYANNQESFDSNIITSKDLKSRLYCSLVTYNSIKVTILDSLQNSEYYLQLQYKNGNTFENVGNKLYLYRKKEYIFNNLSANTVYKIKLYDRDFTYITDTITTTHNSDTYTENSNLETLTYTVTAHTYDAEINVDNLNNDKIGVEIYTSSSYIKPIKYLESSNSLVYVEDLLPNSTYYLKVFRVVGTEKSTSSSANFTTANPSLSTNPITTAPVLSNVALLNEHEVEVTYTKVPNATKYILELSNINTFDYLIKPTYYFNGNKLVITTLLPTTNYYARLYATNGINRSDYSNSVQIYTGN